MRIVNLVFLTIILNTGTFRCEQFPMFKIIVKHTMHLQQHNNVYNFEQIL